MSTFKKLSDFIRSAGSSIFGLGFDFSDKTSKGLEMEMANRRSMSRTLNTPHLGAIGQYDDGYLTENEKMLIDQDIENTEHFIKSFSMRDIPSSSVIKYAFKHHGSIPDNVPFSVLEMSNSIKEILADDRYCEISPLHQQVVTDLISDRIKLNQLMDSPQKVMDFVIDKSMSIKDRASVFLGNGLDDPTNAKDFLASNEAIVSQEFYDEMLRAHGNNANMGSDFRLSSTMFVDNASDQHDSHFDKIMLSPVLNLEFTRGFGASQIYKIKDNDQFMDRFESLPPEVKATYIAKNPELSNMISRAREMDPGRNFDRTLVSKNAQMILSLPQEILTEDLLFRAVSSGSRKDLSFLDKIENTNLFSPRVVAAAMRDDINNSSFMPEKSFSKDVLTQCFEAHGKIPDTPNVPFTSIVAAMGEIDSNHEKYAISDRHRISINEWNTLSREYAGSLSGMNITPSIKQASTAGAELADKDRPYGLGEYQTVSEALTSSGSSPMTKALLFHAAGLDKEGSLSKGAQAEHKKDPHIKSAIDEYSLELNPNGHDKKQKNEHSYELDSPAPYR